MSKAEVFHKVPFPELVNQINDKTCVQACLAMITGASIKNVIRATGGGALCPDDRILFLAAHGVLCEQLNQTGWVYGVYLVSAPSLNVGRKTHQLIVNVRPDWPKDSPWQVLDPQSGREGKEAYTDEDMKSGEMCWHEPFLVRRPDVNMEKILNVVLKLPRTARMD